MLFYSKIANALAIIFVPHRFHLQPLLSFNSIIAMEKFGWKRNSSFNYYYHWLCICGAGKSFSEPLLPGYTGTREAAFSNSSQMAGAG